MQPHEIADIVRSVITQERTQQATRRAVTQRPAQVTPVTVNSRVRVIENHVLQDGTVVSTNQMGWIEVKLDIGTTVSRRTPQSLLVTHIPDVSVPTEMTLTESTPAPMVTAPTARPLTFSWLYVPLISLAESVKSGSQPRVTCFSVEHTTRLVGLKLFTDCASLLAEHLSTPVAWQDTYISATEQERVISPINNNPLFQQLLHTASSATKTVSATPSPAPVQRKRHRETASSATSSIASSSLATYVEEGDAL